MRNFVQRLLGIGKTRAFDAAGGGRRWESAKTVDGLNAAILAGATTAARRAGWYARNNPWVAAAVDSLVGNVVGAGIKPQSTHPDRTVRERLQALWLRWTDHADPADRDARTVEVIWSTGAPVRRRDMAGEYIERLSLDPEAVDLSRLDGASVLDAHRQSAVRDVLGSVREAAVDGRRGTARIQFSARPEVEPIWQDVLAGILRHVSVGYAVEEWAESKENGARVLTAVRWTPHEISLVPTPADPGAKIRMENDMTETDTKAAEAPPATETQTRAAVNAEIRSIARIAGLDQSWVDGQIDGNADADGARRAAFEALARRSSPAIRTEQVRVEIGESQDEPALRSRQMGEALYARINPQHQLSEPARRYRSGWTIPC